MELLLNYIGVFTNTDSDRDSQEVNWYGRFMWKKSVKECVFSKLQAYSLLLTRDFFSSAFFGTFCSFYEGFFTELFWTASICAVKHARNRMILTSWPLKCCDIYFVLESKSTLMDGLKVRQREETDTVIWVLALLIQS